VPSEHTQGGLLDVMPQHRMQAVARRDVNGNFQFILKKLLDACDALYSKNGVFTASEDTSEAHVAQHSRTGI